jgi:hypothetical protein
VILGLSHVFGESIDPAAATTFWLQRGWQVSLSTTLAVPNAKRALMIGTAATHVDVHYLVRQDRLGLPGIEFLHHHPRQRSVSARPTVTLQLPGSGTQSRDPDGNVVVEQDVSTASVTLGVRDPVAARHRLSSVGFVPDNTRQDELRLSAKLLTNRSVTVVLVHDDIAPSRPSVDAGGWNGLSFIVHDLDRVGRYLPLESHQAFSSGGPGAIRELAFFAGDGLLLEFIRVGSGAASSMVDARQ